MKKFSLLALVSLAIVGGATAQTKTKGKVEKIPTKISCAVQKGDMVTIADATKDHMYADYKGRRYFFCCKGCPEAFNKNKAKYAKSPSIPTPKKGK